MKSIRLTLIILLCNQVFLSAYADDKTSSANEKHINEVNKLFRISSGMIDKGNYQGAVKVALNALTIAEKQDNYIVIARANMQVGRMLYFNQEPYKKIINHYQKAREYIYKFSIDSLKQRVNYNIGVVYIENNLPDSAKFYLKKVFEEKNAMKNIALISKTYSVLADLHLIKLKNIPLAGYYVNKAMEYGDLSKDEDAITFALIKQGIYYSIVGEFEKSLDCFERVRLVFEKYNSVEDRMYIYRLIAFAKATQANPEITIAFEKFINLRDSVLKAESTRQTAKYQVLYETEKKDRAIKMSIAEANNQRNLNRIQLLLFVGVIMIIIFVAFFIYFQLKNRQREKLLQETNRLEKLRFLAVIESEESERKRIAVELHDGLGQLLSTSKMNLSGLSDVINQSDEDDKVVYQTALGLIDDAVAEVRNISHNMMPGALIKLGLMPALNDLIRKINIAGKINARFDFDEKIGKMNETTEIAVFRIVQKVLNNCLKHAQAQNIKVEIRKQADEIFLNIEDDGKGLNVSDIENSSGIGWKNIYSRVAMLNGKIVVNADSQGTQIHISFKYTDLL